MTAESIDVAIRLLVHDVALATVEYCAERAHQGKRGLLEMRDEIASEMAELVMECADEDSESAVHAVRAAGGGR